MKRKKSAIMLCSMFCVIFLLGNSVYPQTNIALNKPFAVSSWDTTGMGANGIGMAGWLANDGDVGTRWATDWYRDVNKDSGWFYIDLQTTHVINRVVIQWEVGSALHYAIQVAHLPDPLTQANFNQLATDAAWTTVADITNGVSGETRTITFSPTAANQVRMRGYSRNTTYGYSIWEFQCFDAPLTGPAITTQPLSLTRTVGQSATFTVVATGNPAPTCQWRKNGTNISGATSASYTIAAVAVADAATYTVVVTNSVSNVTSSGAVLTVTPQTSAPVITTQPLSQTKIEGQPVTFTVVATGNPVPTYQWRKNGTNISGATSASYTIAAVAAGDAGTYTVVVTNSVSNVTSNGAVLTVTPSTSAPVITTQPKSDTANLGESVTFTVAATGNPAPTYQWRKNVVNITGATLATYTISPVTATDAAIYTVVVSNSVTSVTSQNAVLTIPVKAGFSVSGATGKIPFSVIFTDTSIGAVTKRYWYFGDNSGLDSSAAGPSHTYATEGSFNAKLVVFDGTGKRADSMTVVIRTYKDNPVLISGRLIPPDRVEITYTNYSVLPTGPLPPFADSIALWYKPGSIPLSGTGATYAKTYIPATMQSQGKGAPVKDTLALQQPFADTVYGYITAVHWTDGTWSRFAAGNGCLVLVKDTSTPGNLCGIGGKYLGTDSAAIVISNMRVIDTSAVDTFGVWYGTSGSDSVPDFGSGLTRWYNLKQSYNVISAAGRDSIVTINAQFNAGVVKTIWCSVIIKGKNDKYSKVVKGSFPVGVNRPLNPIVLTAEALSASTIYLSWPGVTAVEAIRIMYRANTAVPVDNYYFDSAQYFTAHPFVTDTVFAVTGLQEKTHYYFGAQVYKGGLWSVVTQASSASDSTPEAGASLDANRIRLDSCTFDPVTNRIKVAWRVGGALVRDSLQVGISYSITGYPSSEALAQQVVPVLGAKDTTVVMALRENLLFNTPYYIALWERREGGKWTAPTDSSRGTVTSGNYTWQTVTYFTKLGSDTAFAFNNNIRIMTDSVNDIGGVVRTTEKVVYWQPDPSLFSGFIPASIAFRFETPQSSARFYVGLRYTSLPVTYSAADLRVYRFKDNIWSAESTVVLDAQGAQNGYVSVKTNTLGSAFMVLLDTQSVSVDHVPHSATVPEYTDLYDTFTVSDNSGNVKWKFMCAKGADAYSAGGNVTAGTLGNAQSGTVIVHIPYSYVTGDNGVRAVLVANDGVHVTKTDVSRQVIRLNSDYVRTEPMKWVPLRVTATLDSPQVRYALRDPDDGTKPWTYDTRKMRMFKWYPNAQNATSEQKWVEYSDGLADVFKFQSGGLIWIKTREEAELNFGPGVTIPVNASQPIVIAANTWTDMALPYKFNIKIGDILDSTSVGTLNADSLQIYGWERDSSGVFRTQPVYIADLAVVNLANKTATLGCLDLTGYTVWNPLASEQITMRVPPIPEAMSRYGQGLPKKSLAGWAVKVRSGLESGSRLTDVYCVYDPSKGGAMRYYPLSPTFENSYVGLYDADRRKVYGHALSGELSSGGCAYRLAFVNGSASEQRFVYSLEPTGADAGTITARLYSESTGRYEEAQSTIVVAANSTQYRWLYAGSEGYLSKAGVQNVSVLRLIGTYPNPFRSMVHIRYGLPASGVGAVRFTICDLRGTVVWRQSISGQDHNGAGEVVWNAQTKAGRPAAAGIYLLRMSAYDVRQNQTGVFERKMTLIP